jgi:hypothetical protein
MRTKWIRSFTNKGCEQREDVLAEPGSVETVL